MPRYILVQANLNIILNCPDVLRAVGLNYLYQPQISQDKPQSMLTFFIIQFVILFQIISEIQIGKFK